MNEYQKLLQHYGVSTPELPYGGLSDGSDAATQERSAYDKWLAQYRARTSASMYGPGFQGEALGAPAFTSPAKQTTPTAPTTTTVVPTAPTIVSLPQPSGSYGGEAAQSNPATGNNTNFTDGQWDKIRQMNDQYGFFGNPVNQIGLGALGSLVVGDYRGAMSANQRSQDAVNGWSMPAVATGDTNSVPVNTTTLNGIDSASDGGFSTWGRGAGEASPTNSENTQTASSPVNTTTLAGIDSASDGGFSTWGRGAGSDSDGASGGGMAAGGLAQKYAEGGLAELNDKYAPDVEVGHGGLDLSRVSPEQFAFLSKQDPGALQRGIQRFSNAQQSLPEMSQKYQGPAAPAAAPYAAEYAAARSEDKDARAQFNAMMQQAMKQDAASAPSKAEMYFNLAAAFGAPTRTGNFMESVGNAGKVLGEDQKAQREAALANNKQRTALAMQLAQQRAVGAKADLGDLRALTVEELKERRQQSNPQSAAGKQALDEGLTPGTAEYQKRVSDISEMVAKRQTAQIDALVAAQGNQGKRLELATEAAAAKKAEGSKLTPTELKLKTETEDTIASSDKVIGTLADAFKLNPNTFDTSLLDKAQRAGLEAVGSKDKKLENTRLLENMLSDQAVAGLKASFGGNPTEGERAIILSLQGIGAKSVEERGKIITRAYQAAKVAKERHAKRLADINAGKYRTTTPDAPLDTGE